MVVRDVIGGGSNVLDFASYPNNLCVDTLGPFSKRIRTSSWVVALSTVYSKGMKFAKEEMWTREIQSWLRPVSISLKKVAL